MNVDKFTVDESERAILTLNKHSRTSFEKNCFSAWASTLNMGLINKVDMVCKHTISTLLIKTIFILTLTHSFLC